MIWLFLRLTTPGSGHRPAAFDVDGKIIRMSHCGSFMGIVNLDNPYESHGDCPPRMKGISMPDELASFVTSKTAVGLSLRTVEWYAAIVKRYLDWAHNQGLRKEKPETVEAYLAQLRTEGKKPATISGCYRSLSVYFKWMVERRKLRHSPLEHIAPPKSPIKRVKHITPEQFKKLYESFPNDTWWRRRDPMHCCL